jgi:hypothetical protein
VTEQPLVVRPRRLTRMCWAMAGLLVVVFALVGWGLRGGTPGEMQFGLLDQLAMTALGLLLAATVLVFTRARVVAGVDGVRVRNAVREVGVPWELVTEVRLDEGDSWARLELHDDDSLALLAVQANDGERAVAAVRALRDLLAASRERR